MTRFCLSAILTILICNFGLCINLRNTYTAAVVDYVHVKAEYPGELISKNIKYYENIIQNASRQYADIIVFPEYGLVNIYALYAAAFENVYSLEAYSTFIPDPTQNAIPCKDQNSKLYSEHLIKISCAASYHEIYTVINLPEKEVNSQTGNLSYYNTNVVFNKSGAIIAKHRKIHLSEEPFLNSGNELVTFKTDFNVTFGIFTCFDILFKYPALDILEKGVTDIIFPTAWYSETPFLQALSIQHGYAKRNGINFLAADLQEPTQQDGGSGIYLADGTFAEVTISSEKKTKVIIQEVPIIKARTPASLCQLTSDAVKEKHQNRDYKHQKLVINTEEFPISRENLDKYIYAPLKVTRNTLKRICNEDKRLCCSFNITMEYIKKPEYYYRLAIYRGLSIYGSDYYGGVQTCSILACLNESDSSCGYKLSTNLKGVTFASIYVEAVVEKTNNTYVQPTTLRHDLTPIEDYIYCERDINKKQIQITMQTTAPVKQLLSFGLYGRLYNLDSKPTEPPPPQEKELNVSLIAIILSGTVIVLFTTAVILYKYCTKKD